MADEIGNKENDLVRLELIQERDLSELEAKILDVLAYGMLPAAEGGAAEAARRIDEYCPAVEQEQATRDYLWTLWVIVLDIARSPSTTSEIHKGLISILDNLWQCARGELKVHGITKRLWRDLPLLPMCTEAYFNDPISATGEVAPRAARIWRNLNTFGARCMGAGILGPYAEAMDAMLFALEGAGPVTELRVLVAIDWITHGGKALLGWAEENTGYLDVSLEDDANHVAGGPLYHGPSTMCFQRWGFWMDRFTVLGREGSGLTEETREAATETAQEMRVMEQSVGHVL